MSIFKKIINHKLNTITESDLLKLGQQYGISISRDEAKKIAAFLRGKNFNIFNDTERAKVIKEVEKISGTKTAKEVEKLLNQLL